MTLAQLGTVAIAISLILAFYALLAALWGDKTKRISLVQSATYALYTIFALLTLASLVMWFSLGTTDIFIKYVHHSVDHTTPWIYRLVAYWGGLDGSMLLWAWLLSGIASLAVFLNFRRHESIIAIVIAVLATMLLFFIGLLVFYKQPFLTFLDSVPTQGKGLTPSLQDPYMTTHPPSLYIGYIMASIPFAFGLATLIKGEMSNEWLQSVRRWMLVCFYFLSQGLILGGLWAYHTLGWSGFWAWDPVENAGLLPWFTATAFLHSMRIQERQGMLKVWNLVLVILTFLLTIIGTFLTRSGVVNSIHAFGNDLNLTIAFLIFIVIIIVVSFGFLIYRTPMLRGTNRIESWLSREFAFLVNNWILLVMAFFVLVATIFPIISKQVLHKDITVGAPFYNRFMAPLGLTLLLLMGIAPLLAWRKTTGHRLVRQFAFPVVFMTIFLIGLPLAWPGIMVKTAFFSEKISLPVAWICFGISALAFGGIIQEFILGIRSRMQTTGAGAFKSFGGLINNNRRRYGGYLVHVGIVLMFIGFAGQAYKREQIVSLRLGESVTMGNYSLVFRGTKYHVDEQKKTVMTELFVLRNGQELTTIAPGRTIYFNHIDEGPRSEIAIYSTAGEDLYVVLQTPITQEMLTQDVPVEIANLQVNLNPIINWVWVGFVWLLLGTVVAYLPERLYRRKKGQQVAAIVVVLFLGFSGVSYAASVHEGTNVAQAKTAIEKKLQQKLVCMCGSCPREALATCSCTFAAKRREQIANLLAEGKTPEQVVEVFRAEFGMAVLIEPPDQGVNRVLKLLPLLGLLIGLVLLVVLRLRKKAPPSVENTKEIPEEYLRAVDADWQKGQL